MGRIFGSLLALRKSMLGQMALLTTIFLIWGVYAFVVRPILDITPTETQPAIDATASDLRDAIHAFMSAERDKPGSAAPIATQPIIRAVQARNPAFRYYIRVGDRAFGTAPAVYYRRLHLDRLERTHRDMRVVGICSQTSDVIGGLGSGSYADFYMCDSVNYFEYRGLLHPVPRPATPLPSLYERWLWAFSGNFLVAAGGVFLIFALILIAHTVLIRRVAALARSFDPRHLDRQLPEKGLASEILPLVRAINHMIARVDDFQRRSTFFLSAAAHEMRTPLTVLRTRLEMLDDGAIKDKLIGDVQRLIELVNQLLALMSIGNRKEVTAFVDVVACGREAIAESESVAAGCTVALVFDSEVSDYEILGDATLLRSAIANLIRNASSFSPAGGQIAIRFEAGGRLSVRDAGPGIAHPNPAALFEPFVRSPPSRRGYGLGLAIVKAVATLHDATVEAANADGGGAVFTIAFPPQS